MFRHSLIYILKNIKWFCLCSYEAQPLVIQIIYNEQLLYIKFLLLLLTSEVMCFLFNAMSLPNLT